MSKVCTHTHIYWAGLVSTCAFCGANQKTTDQKNRECDERITHDYNDSIEDVDRFNKQSGGGHW